MNFNNIGKKFRNAKTECFKILDSLNFITDKILLKTVHLFAYL
jgi:hypothetical protein